MSIRTNNLPDSNEPDLPRQTLGARSDQLVLVHTNCLHRYAYWLTNNRSVAEELVQETMFRAWRSINQLNEPEAAKAWLLTILRRENARRFEHASFQAVEFPVERTIDRRCTYDTSTEAFVLRRAFKKLPLDYRESLVMQVIHGYSLREIAVHSGLSLAGAGSRLFRARQKLRELVTSAPS